ncbi:DUF1796 family putative cysteine peptidase [Bacillus sp. B1-b2]|uniref:DUF1796 family putative cysteine peptidase n=1 Tax=Bacillus sp. B1-b2 TaxID=2653201 RepID=UPI001261EB1E|nr:DUF1796 family putative cysteine peptidase [Bacillus sp. B1-b2]KAB7671188.1 peptidase [Bacillus sp. B1-b2]
MYLSRIKGEYDVIFSLGNNCLPAMKLRDNQLRTYAGPFDWVGSPDLSKVIHLLENHFANFLDLKNLKGIQYLSDYDMLVFDEQNVISFNHDFKRSRNKLDDLQELPEIKEKYDRRIARFLTFLSSAKRILFIRTEGTLEEVIRLEEVLRKNVKNDFHLLVVNHTEGNQMTELYWPLEKVTAIELPNGEIWEGNNHYWKYILDGIHISS